jgi:amino acid transporter
MAQPRLPRVLSLFDLVVLAGASMGPAFSLATTMGPMVAAAGGSAPLALVLLTVVMGLVAIAFARMLRVLPNAGSSYSWIRSAFGNGAGAYGAWLLILSNLFAVLATALPAGAYTLDLLAPALAQSPLWIALVACGWIVASAALLWAGLRPTSRVAALLFFGEVAVLAATAAASFAHPAAAAPSAPAHPAAGLGGIVLAMAIGIWMTDGWEVTASTSEETRGGRDLPGIGGLLGLGLTSALLLACMIAYLHVGTVAGFAEHEEDALAYVAARLGSGGWVVAIAATVLISLMASLQTTIVYLSRSVYAMGRDGVLPAAIGRLDRRGTPAGSIVLVAAVVSGFTLLTGFSQSARDAYNVVLSGSAIFLGALFMFSTAATARTFAREPREQLAGLVVPVVATVLLGAILVAGFLQSDAPTRTFIAGGALLGLPLAAWRRTVIE